MYGLRRVSGGGKRLLRSVSTSRRAAAGIDRKRRQTLPKELSGNVVTLTCDSSAAAGVCNVYIVGTNHDSPKSWSQVQAAVRFFKPEAVFLELCSNRLYMLGHEKLKVPTMREMVNMWKENHKPSWIIFKWYKAVISTRINNQVDRVWAGDSRAAYEEAMKCGAKIILGDRPKDITEQRYWAKTSLMHLLEPKNCPILHDLSKKLNEKFDAYAVDRYKHAIAKKFPAWAETYIHERDLYMSAKLLEVAREHDSVVAVVGMCHVPGIKTNWKQSIDVEQLLSIPTGKKPLTLQSVVLSIRTVVKMAVVFFRVTCCSIKR